MNALQRKPQQHGISPLHDFSAAGTCHNCSEAQSGNWAPLHFMVNAQVSIAATPARKTAADLGRAGSLLPDPTRPSFPRNAELLLGSCAGVRFVCVRDGESSCCVQSARLRWRRPHLKKNSRSDQTILEQSFGRSGPINPRSIYRSGSAAPSAPRNSTSTETASLRREPSSPSSMN